MTLTLQLRDHNRLLPGGDATRVLESGSLTIGRGAENDLVLPDPERVISKQHCLIEAVDDHFVLTDASSNGVFLNGEGAALGRGKSVTLSDGDQIRISHFQFEVKLGPPNAAGTGAFDGGASAFPEDNPSDLFGPETGSDDRLAEILEVSPSPQASAFAEPVPGPIPGDDLLLDGGPGGAGVKESAAAMEQIPAQQDVFELPEAAQEIPDDWDEGSSPEEPSAMPAMEPTAPDWPETEDPFVAAPPEPARNAVSVPAPPEAPAPPPVQIDQPRPAPAAATAVQQRKAIEAFLEGAGLQDVEIREDEAAQTLELLGQIFREVVLGMMEVLAARSSIKSEFRLSLTTIQPVENNPLKFSLGVDDALSALLTKRGRGYLPPLRAFQEGFDDIKAHQVAMLAGMQVALSGLLERFDPQALERRISDDKGLGNLLSGKKSRYWDEFTKLYDGLVAEAEDDFQNLFGREFGRAYEEQVRKHGKNRTRKG